MSFKATLLLILLAAVAGPTRAAEAPTPVGLEYCTVCHGSQLKGNANIGAPRLSGLSQWYVKRQLLNFKQGIRGAHAEDLQGGEMKSMVAHLSDQDIAAITQWIGQTESPQPKATIAGDIAMGKSLYQGCAACHSGDASGNETLGAPSLQGLNDWYLLTQINHFRLGIRGSESGDVYGQQMQAASNLLTTETDAADLAAYISQLN